MSSSNSQETILEESKAWIEKFIIRLNICPFAGPSFKQDRIEYQIVEKCESVVIIESFLKLVSKMIASTEFSNSFLIIPEIGTFDHYLDLYYTCEDLLEESKTDQLIQLASFHPQYQYDGLENSDIANFRNRSPYAMIHLLRVEEVEQVIEQHNNTLEIPEINAEKLRRMGKEDLMEILKTTSKKYE